MTADQNTAVSCRQVVKIYPTNTGQVEAVRGVDLELRAGTATGIVGPSGSGKSSLLRMIAGLDEPTAGRIHVADIDLFSLSARERAKRRGQLVTHVYQRPSDNLLGHISAHQLLCRLSPRHGNPSPDDALGQLDLLHRRDHLPAAMSGGEQQRLALARAIVAGHKVVIADEPTAHLDPAGAASVLEAIATLTSLGTTVIVATHDDRVLPKMDEIVTLRDGSVASVTHAGRELAVIDRSGRLQLDPAVRSEFADGRARLLWDAERRVLEVHQP